MQPHPTHHTRTPRSYRDATPVHTQRRSTRGAWHIEDVEAHSPKTEFASAQTIFLIARGLAVLVAAVAVGLGGMSGHADTAPTPPPTSSHATTR